jgi:bidirectional [NiFe] hydrogenase diaphorase subunit
VSERSVRERPGRGNRRPFEVVIDGRTLQASEGESVLDVARRGGIAIPSLCYLKGLSVWGACRLCVVEVSARGNLVPACATAAVPDMEVHTDTSRLRAHRRSIVEMLFAEGNHVCAVCTANGHCELQDVAVATGMDHVRLDYQAPSRSVDASHPQYVFDPNRCILCTRCVRACDEIEGAHVWDVASRGQDAYLVSGLGAPWGEVADCTWCGKCVAACPTGALAPQRSSVGEVRREPDVINRLVTARRDHVWLPPQSAEERQTVTGRGGSHG